jgi:type II secretory pathway pseudopilin PulG
MSFYTFCCSFGRSSKSGLTRIEFVVLGGVILILAGIVAWTLPAYLHRITRAVESAQTLSTLLSQYATDNNGTYPVGEGTPAVGRSEGIARNLLANNYTPDASVFAIGSTEKYHGDSADFADLTAANLSWDFTAGANATTGILSSDPDTLPTVYTTGQTVAYPAPGAGLDLPFSGTGPLGTEGLIVAYKGNNAVFIKSVTTAAGTTCPGFISKDFKAPGPYTQIKP